MPLDRDIGNAPLVALEDRQQAGIETIDIVADDELAGVVDKGGLVGQMDRNATVLTLIVTPAALMAIAELGEWWRRRMSVGTVRAAVSCRLFDATPAGAARPPPSSSPHAAFRLIDDENTLATALLRRCATGRHAVKSHATEIAREFDLPQSTTDRFLIDARAGAPSDRQVRMAQYPANIDLSSLNGTNGFKLSGVGGFDHSGSSVASAGDVNGDGFADLIVGAPDTDPHGLSSGASYVIFGKASGFAANIGLSSLNGSNGFKLSGVTAYDHSGWSVASAGDVNGDGFADLIVGAPDADPHGIGQAGMSYVVFGKASGFPSSIDVSTLNGTTGFTISGVAAGDESGLSVASAGDVNGDGLADLIVGAPGADPHGTNSGASYVIFGRTSGISPNVDLSSLDGSNGFKLSGPVTNPLGDQSGFSVASAGDVNGDGVADLIVGAPHAHVPLQHAMADGGASYVVFGRTSGFPANIDLSGLDGTSGFKISGVPGDFGGYSVASAGDVNGDGYADLIVGEPWPNSSHGTRISHSYVVFGKASGFAADISLSNLNGTNGFEITGAAGDDRTGTAVASAGDVNGDGFDDLIVGAPGLEFKFGHPYATAGATYVVFGKASGFAANINLSSLDGANGFKLSDAELGSLLGKSVASAGDVNGDGLADLIVGAGADRSSGASYVVVGKLPDSAVNRTGTDAPQNLVGGNFDDTLSGLGGDDKLYGHGGNDTLNGGTGADTMIGGPGNDVYYADNAGDQVVENSGEGSDTVFSTIAYTLPANVENLTLTGSANLSGTGNTLANVITGNTGIDTLTGGDGNDVYYLHNSADQVVEGNGAASGTDTIYADFNLALPDNVENLTLTGSANLSGTGNALDNVITSNGGIDILTGGDGNDSYVVHNSATQVIEAANGGDDQVATSVDYALMAGSEVETLTALDPASTTALTLTGNEFDNRIVGNAGANVIDGGLGKDTLIGGDGNDVYYVDNSADQIVEGNGASSGTDTVYADLSITLPDNVENLTLTGSANLSGTGNTLDNVITGNTGIDTLTGGDGNDSYVVHNSATQVIEAVSGGDDQVATSVDYALTAGSEVETLTALDPAGTTALTLTGNEFDNRVVGNAGANVIDGGSGDDVLEGMGGPDALNGGPGSGDLASYEHAGSAVIASLANPGADTGDAAGDTYTGIEGLIGSSYGDTLAGDSASNQLFGGPGSDTLNGGSGADDMAGGTGNDAYYVDSTGDQVVENSGEGSDTVFATIGYALPANVENLVLRGNGNLNATGNSLGNTLYGNYGVDTLTGGDGNDVYYVRNTQDQVVENGNVGSGRDEVYAFVDYTLPNNVETLVLRGTGNLSGTGNALDNVIYSNTAVDMLAGGDGNDLYLVHNSSDVIVEGNGARSGTDIVYADVSVTLPDNVENLTLMGSANLGGTGNALDNVIRGNAGNNTLNGGIGADTMIGGPGNDVYYVDNAGDQIVENSRGGTDTVFSTTDYTLPDNVENLVLRGNGNLDATGNSLGNTLYGNYGVDTLTGGDGNDIYYIRNSADTIIEGTGVGSGADTVYAFVDYTLPDNVEALVLRGAGNLNGTGNALDNVIYGNSDVDRLAGGDGNDLYVVHNSADVIVEGNGASSGIDTVFADVDFTLPANVENLTLTGSANLSGTGNALDNVITGNTGIDTLTGGDGNDTYVIRNGATQVVEAANGGNDQVITSVDYALAPGSQVETLTALGSGSTTPLTLTGNEFANRIVGNAGNNVIDGGLGNDTITTYGGHDTIVFDTALNAATNVDQIYDLSAANDTIRLAHSVFTQLAAGALPASEFVTGAAAQDGNDYIVYDDATGALSYDADGNGSGAAIQFATLAAHLALTSGDFIVV